MSRIDLKELLLYNPQINEKAVLEGIELTEELKSIPVEPLQNQFEPTSSPIRIRVIGSPGQRLGVTLRCR